jgi:hypothetical protein
VASLEDPLREDEVEAAVEPAARLGHSGDLGEPESAMEIDGCLVAGVDPRGGLSYR